mmetsp:Transcript_45617/g.126588  ORF Transcript_45617/g.126588 Transcript_45617/m.126588 type:complete len:375 (+) Transcript_45617:214-1338(+)
MMFSSRPCARLPLPWGCDISCVGTVCVGGGADALSRCAVRTTAWGLRRRPTTRPPRARARRRRTPRTSPVRAGARGREGEGGLCGGAGEDALAGGVGSPPLGSRARPLDALLLLQHGADPVGEDVAQRLPDELRIAVHEVDKERVEALQVAHKLGLVELEDALQQHDHVGRQLLADGLRHLRAGLGGLVYLEIVAEHVQAEGDEPVLGGGRDEQHVGVRAERRRLALGRWREARLDLRKEREEHLQVEAHRLELHVQRLVVELALPPLGRAHEAVHEHAVRLVVHRVHAVEEALYVAELHRRVHRLQQLVDCREQQHLQLMRPRARRRLGLHLGRHLAQQRARRLAAVGGWADHLGHDGRRVARVEARLELRAD